MILRSNIKQWRYGFSIEFYALRDVHDIVKGLAECVIALKRLPCEHIRVGYSKRINFALRDYRVLRARLIAIKIFSRNSVLQTHRTNAA